MALVAGLDYRLFDSASLTAIYQQIPGIITGPVYQINITNSSNVDIFISRDGVKNEILVPKNTSVTLSSQRTWNSTPSAVYILPKGSYLYIKQVTAAGTGNIIINLLSEQ